MGVQPSYTFSVGAKKVEKTRSTEASALPAEEPGAAKAKNSKKDENISKKAEKKKTRLSNVARKLDLEKKKMEMTQQYLMLLTEQLMKNSNVPQLATPPQESNSD